MENVLANGANHPEFIRNAAGPRPSREAPGSATIYELAGWFITSLR